MRTFGQTYLRTVGFAALALIPTALGCPLFLVALSYFSGTAAAGGLETVAAISLLVVMYAITVGLILITLVGAPLYAVLVMLRRDSWPFVLAAGALPGALCAALDPALGYFAVACGILVAAATHQLSVRHRTSPCKPTTR